MDIDLVRRAQTGDHEAFTALVAMSIDRMYATAGLILRSNERAEEAVQEALIRAWLGCRALRDPGRWDPWLRRLLINACYSIARKDRSRRVVELQIDGSRPPSAPDGAAHLADRDQIARGFHALTAEQRAVIVARYYLDLSDAEAAEALAIPLGTMKSRLHRAMAALHAALQAEERRPASRPEVA